jgi:hypothetical protein
LAWERDAEVAELSRILFPDYFSMFAWLI